MWRAAPRPALRGRAMSKAFVAAAEAAGLPAAYLKELAALLPPRRRARREPENRPAVRPRWASPLQVKPDPL